MLSSYRALYFSFQMHFKMSSAICFNLDQSRILSSGNGVITQHQLTLDHHLTNVKILASFFPFLLSAHHKHKDQGNCPLLRLWICRVQLEPIGLTHSHTKTPFDGSGKEAFWKHCGKRRNCLYKQFLLFPQCFLLYQRQKLSFLLHLSSANAVNLVWSKILLCGNALI